MAVKILVLADSHTDVDTMLAVAETEKPDAILHLGDHAPDAHALQSKIGIPVHLVKGNTDKENTDKTEEFLTFEGTEIYMTHGHLYHVGRGSDELAEAARQMSMHIALFGHTHVPYLRCAGGLWLMNPGSINRAKSLFNHATYGVITLRGSILRCEIVQL